MMHRIVSSPLTVILTGVLLLVAAESDPLTASDLPGYQQPPKPILDVLHAPQSPMVSLSPKRDRMLLVQYARYPEVDDLAAPMLSLAGHRINPTIHGPHRMPRIVSIDLLKIGTDKPVNLFTSKEPHGTLGSGPIWSPNGVLFAFTLVENKGELPGIKLWLGDSETGKTQPVELLTINATLGEAVQWMPDGKTLLCQRVSDVGHSVPRHASRSPIIQESFGKQAPVRTFQDLLKNPYDEVLFEMNCTSELVLVNAQDGTWHGVIGDKKLLFSKSAIFNMVEPSPNGEYLLVSRIVRPYSYLHPASAFPKEVEVWNLKGEVIVPIAKLPLADQVPIEGVPTGPRGFQWQPTEPAMLFWVEALDDGDPKKKVPHRDKVMVLDVATLAKGTPTPIQEVARTQHRYAGITWSEKNGQALLRDYDRDRRWSRTFLMNVNQPQDGHVLLFDRSIQDRYGDPGTPLMKPLPNGQRVLWQDGDHIYLSGSGSSPKGDRPFLDRFNLKTKQSERLWQCDDTAYESVVALLDEKASQFITRHEDPATPPNYYMHLRSSNSEGKKALTNFNDPTPQLRQIKKERVVYKRPDGVQLSFTLYYPPGYEKGKRYPAVLWAYPREFNDPATAGQVAGSTQRFTTLGGSSHLFFLLAGYVVLDDATMPVVGDPETANNTFLEQIVASAKAAIDKADEMGVIDPKRVGVGGHSYGAFMTANLLAHSDLFRAGIARSGAYNRTLTPFGFQNERRTFWEAPDIYVKMSPFAHAHKIKEPVLLIHGAADNNPGTFTMQSERLYQAIRGNGGNVRLVLLPHESHGYAARQSIEHTLYEMIAWFDKHVKDTK